MHLLAPPVIDPLIHSYDQAAALAQAIQCTRGSSEHILMTKPSL